MKSLNIYLFKNDLATIHSIKELALQMEAKENIAHYLQDKSQKDEILRLAKEYGYKIVLHAEFGTETSLEEGYHQIILYKGEKVVKKESRILIATTNSGKAKIYEDILKSLNLSYCTLRDFDCNKNVEETGKTELENSIIKAEAFFNEIGLPLISNDSGLIIEKLKPEDQPGVFVRRYGGRELTDEETIEIFSQKLLAVGGESDSYFNVALTLVDQEGNKFSKLFKSYRYMTAKRSNVVIKGLPLRSLDYNKKLGKYMSEMTIEEANACEGDCFIAQKEFIKECFIK